MSQTIIPKVFMLMQRVSHYKVERGFLRITKVVHNVLKITSIEGFRRFPITKDREQLRTANKNYLVINQTSTHENITPHYDCPATAPEKGLDDPQVYEIVVASFDK